MRTTQSLKLQGLVDLLERLMAHKEGTRKISGPLCGIIGKAGFSYMATEVKRRIYSMQPYVQNYICSVICIRNFMLDDTANLSDFLHQYCEY